SLRWEEPCLEGEPSWLRLVGARGLEGSCAREARRVPVREWAMKECPKCQLVNPDTAQVCDCGHSFQTGGTICPKCKSSEGLKITGLADANNRAITDLVVGRAVTQLLYGNPAREVHCTQCGHTFREPIPGSKSRFLALAVMMAIAIVIAIVLTIVN